MDVRLVDGSGIEATREIRAKHPKTQVLMLTSFADDEALFASIMAGASGYVLKQVRSDDLLRAIRSVGGGESLLDPAVTKARARAAPQGQAPDERREARTRCHRRRNGSSSWSRTAGRTRRSATS
jgi:DNA-binding NarL/FixJ family response regulator